MEKKFFLRKLIMSVFVLSIILCAVFMASVEVRAAVRTKEEMKEYIISEMFNFTEEIELGDYNKAALFKTKEEMLDFLEQCKAVAVNVGRFKYYPYYYEDTDQYRLVTILPEYMCTSEDMDEFFKETDKLLEGIKDNADLSDVEKALLLHDRLIANCVYDYEHVDNNGTYEEKPEVYSGYAAIVNKLAVCGGYASAYQYLLTQVGIKCEYVNSQELDHAWNIVYIDDIPYHVDTTWDDDTEADAKGYVSHKHFLVSSNTFYERGHTAKDYSTLPEDSRYDDYFWVDSIAEFQFLDGNIYYIDRNSATLNVWEDGENRELCSVADRWGKYNRRDFNFSLLSNDGEKLLYSLSDAICSYDANSGVSEVVYKPAEINNAENNSIYDFEYLDGEYLCDISDVPLVQAELREIENIVTAQKYMLIGVATIAAMFVVLGIKKRKQKKKIRRKKDEEVDTGRIEED